MLTTATAPAATLAKPSSGTSFRAPGSAVPKMVSAVTRGCAICRMPAVSSRTPTAQNTNHRPSSSQKSNDACVTSGSTSIETTGRTSMKARTMAMYMTLDPCGVVSREADVGNRGALDRRTDTNARAVFKAFEDNDREAIEALIADEFAFTSPFDDRIARETYFERCWPNAEVAESFEIVFAAADGNGAVITYGAATTEGHSFRNTELFT